MTYLEQCEMFLASIQKRYDILDKEYREASNKYDGVHKAVLASRAVLKPLKQMTSYPNEYSHVYEKHTEEAVAINSTLEKEMLELEKQRDVLYRQKFDLEYGSKRILQNKIELMKKAGILSDMINIYNTYYVDASNQELRGLTLDDKRAVFRTNRYANISNFDAKDLGVELIGNLMWHQIAEGASRKASKVFSLGFKDQSLYLIILDFAGKLKTTYILKDDAECASVETHKYDSKIKCFFLRKELEDKIPRADLVKTFFNHLDHVKEKNE